MDGDGARTFEHRTPPLRTRSHPCWRAQDRTAMLVTVVLKGGRLVLRGRIRREIAGGCTKVKTFNAERQAWFPRCASRNWRVGRGWQLLRCRFFVVA